MPRLVLCLTAALLTACASSSYRATPATASLLPLCQLEMRLPRLIDSAGIPGFAMTALIGGKPAWHVALGLREADTRNQVTRNTVFEAASLSKPVLAYMVIRLADQGKLSLDEPLAS